jgi:sulfur carrier protein ThiS
MMPSGGPGLLTNGATPRQYETGGQLTVADLLRREGLSPPEELAAIESPVPGRRRETADFSGDNAPTVQLLVADLLRREGEPPEPERIGKRTKIGIGAGIAALFGLAAIGYAAIQPHGVDPVATTTGQGDSAASAVDSQTALAIQPNLVASTSPTAGSSDPTVATSAPTTVKAAGSATSASKSPAVPTTRSNAPASSATTQAAQPVPTTATPTGTGTSSPSQPVTTPTPTAPVTTPTTKPRSTTPTPTSTTDTGLLGTATGLLSGVISGVLG